MDLPIDVRSVAASRRILRQVLGDDRSERVDDALLMISELVTNAIRHTRHVLVLRVAVKGRLLHVEVADDDPRLPALPALRGRHVHATHTRGCTSSGSSPTAGVSPPTTDGKTVWFDVRLP